MGFKDIQSFCINHNITAKISIDINKGFMDLHFNMINEIDDRIESHRSRFINSFEDLNKNILDEIKAFYEDYRKDG